MRYLKRYFTVATALVVAAGSASAAPAVKPSFKIQRGYFSFPDHEKSVRVTSDADFQVCIWARNTDTKPGGVQVLTPTSQFIGSGSHPGGENGLVMDVSPQKGIDLGCIGGVAAEHLTISGGGDGRVVVFLTIITAPGARVAMDRT